MGTEQYGDHYWYVKLSKPIVGEETEIYVMADKVIVSDAGVTFVSNDDDEVRLHVAYEYVAAVFAASMIDGGAVAIESWEGGVNPKY